MSRKEALGELVTFRTGKLNSNAAVADGAYPFFTCAQETYRTNTCAFDTECVLLAGNNANGTYPIKYFSGKFDAYQRTYVIEPTDTRRLLTRYLYYCLQLQLEHLRSISTGAATKFLTLSLLKEIRISLPPLREQGQIASVLATYDDLIANNTRRIAILEEMAQRIYEEWFVRHRILSCRDSSKAALEIGALPVGWRVGCFGDLAHKKLERYVEERHAELPLIDLSRIPRRSNALVDVGASSELTTSRTVFRQRSVLFGAIRPNFHKVLFAPFDGISNVSVHIFEPKAPFGAAFLFCTAFADRTVAWAVQHAGGMKMPTIGWEVLSRMPVTLPTAEVAKKFDEAVLPMLEQIATLVQKNRNLRVTRDLLLPRLIDGELDVSWLQVPEVLAA